MKKNLPDQHKIYIQKFDKESNNEKVLEEIYKEYERVSDEIERIKEKKSNKKLTKSDQIILEKNRDKKLKLENSINSIKDIIENSDREEIEYFDKINDIIMDYYDTSNINNDVQTEKEERIIIIKNKRKKIRRVNNILSYFDNTEEQKPVQQDENNQDDNKKSRHQITNKYNNILFNETLLTTEKDNLCPVCHCQRDLIIDNGLCICKNCNLVQEVRIESNISNYKDNVIEKPIYPYKRINHLIEWLNRIQGKETANIPPEIYEKVLIEIRKTRETDIKNITIKDIRKILKTLRLSGYYEHASLILSKLTGINPPTLKQETEDRIKKEFKRIEDSFNRNKPAGRTNFPSYSYILNKLFQIMNLNELLDYVPLPKSRDKIIIQDEVWKMICKDLGFEFKQSV